MVAFGSGPDTDRSHLMLATACCRVLGAGAGTPGRRCPTVLYDLAMTGVTVDIQTWPSVAGIDEVLHASPRHRASN